MQFAVTFRHMEASEALKDYAWEKVSRMSKYMDSPLEAHVVLSVEKFRHKCDVTIMSDGFKINGQKQAADMYAAIDLVMDKIERQIKRSRQKLKSHKSRQRVRAQSVRMNVIAAAAEPGTGPEAESGESGSRIVRTKQISAKPMDVDEAVMQLDLGGHQFLVFTNAASGAINVLYRREDGHYGLIEPLPE